MLTNEFNELQRRNSKSCAGFLMAPAGYWADCVACRTALNWSPAVQLATTSLCTIIATLRTLDDSQVSFPRAS